jgi:hypothetical protein
MEGHYHDSSTDSDGDTSSDRMAVIPYHAGIRDGFDPDLHQFLCFGLEGRGRQRRHGPEGSDGFRVVRYGTAPKKYTDKQIKQFSEIYKDYFFALTGLRLQYFELTRSTQKYVSMLEFARGRDRVLATMFERRPVIWDLMAGSGSDGLAFLLDLDPKELILCQRSIPDTDRDDTRFQASLTEYKVMCNNIKGFLQSVPGINATMRAEHIDRPVLIGNGTRTVVKCKHKLAETFLMSQDAEAGTEVDCVYLDPSWDDDHDIGGNSMRGAEMNPEQLFERLEALIWGPIRRKNIKVGCYVIKTRWNWLRVQQYMDSVTTEFQAMYSIRTKPFRPNVDRLKHEEFGGVQGVYHYMVLIHKEYKTVNLNNSQLYWDLVRNGKPVWVKKDSVVGMTRPVYSNHTGFPEYTENDPRDTGEYFMVQPHSKPKRGAPAIPGARTPEEQFSYDSRRFEPAPGSGGPDAEGSSSSDESEPEYDAGANRYGALVPP